MMLGVLLYGFAGAVARADWQAPAAPSSAGSAVGVIENLVPLVPYIGPSFGRELKLTFALVLIVVRLDVSGRAASSAQCREPGMTSLPEQNRRCRPGAPRWPSLRHGPAGAAALDHRRRGPSSGLVIPLCRQELSDLFS